MKKSYSNFTTFEDIKSLGLNVKRRRLFDKITPVEPSAFLIQTLKSNQEIPMESEKAEGSTGVIVSNNLRLLTFKPRDLTSSNVVKLEYDFFIKPILT